MKKVLILGGAGMLGHKVYQALSDGPYERYATVRQEVSESPAAAFSASENGQFIGGIDAFNFEDVGALVDEITPDVIVNCIGVIKQREAAHDAIEAITINSLFPHLLAERCERVGARMVHISTDCVFNGKKGAYVESDPTDATDLYGKSKSLGEVTSPGTLTLRTSIIGRELYNNTSLIEWFLAQDGKKIRGYAKAMYAGLSTLRMAQLIRELIDEHPKLSGLYQVSGPWISKYDLLMLAREAYNLDIEIERDEDVDIDRTLVGDRFAAETGFVAPSWREMLVEMAADPTPYESLKS